LNGFITNNINLTQIALDRCPNLRNGGAGILASAVKGCASVNEIKLTSCNVDDDILVEFVLGIRALKQLRTLDLSGNHFWRAGCKALATLLADNDGNLEYLGLRDNSRIDNNCANILAKSLTYNRKLKLLLLSDNSAITHRGWDAFSAVLCNTSSVNNTYLSNHTLHSFGNVNLPPKLSVLLEVNFVAGNKGAAIRKILLHHAHLDMTPFHVQWDLKALPFAVNWFDKARGYAQNEDESNINSRKLTAVYQFARAMPMLFVPPPSKMTYKRKICEIN